MNFKILTILFLWIACSIGVYASGMMKADIEKNLIPGLDTLTQSELKRDVMLLASDQMRGRLSLDKGDSDAIQWIEAQFKQMGLQPVVGDSYLQAVPLIQYTPDLKKSHILLEESGKITKWKAPDVNTEFFNNIDLTGEVIFAGYGITAPALQYDDYATIDAHGKIVLIFEHEPQEQDEGSLFNGKANTIYATNRVKALNAQAHGAMAVLIAPEPNRKHLSNQERRNRIMGSIKRPTPLPLQVLVNDELQIPVAIISDAVAKKIAGRNVSLATLQAAIDVDLKPRSQLLAGKRITLHDVNTTRTTGITYNVAGLLPGNDSTLKDETVIISAHHDHDGMSKKQIWHGADDNASGTAGVVALARAISTNAHALGGLPLKRSILFVVFGAEERGLLGAYYMAEHPLRPLDTTRAMINFDMIGRNEKPSLQTDGTIDIPADTTNRLNLIGAHYSPGYLTAVEKQNKLIGLDLDMRFDNEPVLNVLFRSDQFPFILKNIPAFWWFTGFHSDYHHTTDTADKINYSKMQKILQLAYLAAYDFSTTDQPPVFVTNPGVKV